MPKKKKTPLNTARGFATTSVASKPKPVKTDSDSATPDTTSKQTPDTSTGQPSGNDSPAPGSSNPQPQTEHDASGKPKELHELSPEELERRLEEADLQTFVDKHAAKTARDSARALSKLQTDCRLLRAQSMPLNVRALVPDTLVLKLVALAQEDIARGKQFLDDRKPAPLPAEDDLTARLWTLQRCLLGTGFFQEQVDAVIRHLLQYPPTADTDALVWGLEDAFDWLCCNFPEEDLPLIDPTTGKAGQLLAQDDEDLEEDLDEPGANGHSKNGDKAKRDLSAQQRARQEEDFEVSDLDSDLESEDLLAVYLRSKTKLLEVDPSLVPAPVAKNKKAPPKAPPTAAPTGNGGAAKLQNKLRKIEQDALFDKGEADLQWANHRILLVREAAERKQMEPPKPRQNGGGKREKSQQETQEREQEDDSSANQSEEDDTALGDLFAAVTTDDAPPDADGPTPDYAHMKIMDFGETKGMEPRRVLEETCKARDSAVKLQYKLVSSSAFSNRHCVVISWARDQPGAFPLESTSAESKRSAKLMKFTMTQVSTPDSRQSLAYISVFALFQVFSGSAKEEKAHLRLPPNWRKLWFDLSDAAKVQSEGRERAEVQKLRQIVSSRAEQDDSDDDVIFTKNFKRRSEAIAHSAHNSLSQHISVPDEQAIQQIWLQKAETPQYQRMLGVRSNLPMWHFKDAVASAVAQNQVTIVCGETGCGKSTQLPSFVLEHQLSQGKPCKIYCTEPRRISAITLAQRVSEELGEAKRDLGSMRSLVGYSIRLESKTSSATRLVYATTGVVLRMLENPDGLADITHVVIDEVHERSIETDFLLIVLRALCARRPDLKVVLMSATVDADRFSKYFYGAPVLSVPGRTFPVETKFLEDAVEQTGHVVDGDNHSYNDNDEVDAETLAEENSTASTANLKNYSKKTRETLAKMNHYNIDYRLICSLVESIATNFQQYSRAILIFLPGIAEIRRLNDMLSSSWIGKQYLIHSLHSSIASEDQQAAFQLPPHGMGKLVLSTNIAETGVTIPDVTCVIDTGQHKEMRFDERRQISRLLNCQISRANAKQRRGRAGRVQQGLCFHMFTKSRHDESMAEQQTPEMLRLSLQDLIMRVKVCKLGDITETLADALDPPLPKNIRRAIDALIEVGALTAQEELTSLGIQLSKLPLDPYLGKLALYGAHFKCLDVCLTLAATLTSKSPFVTPIGARQQADVTRAGFKKGDSDLLTEFNAYTAWRRVCSSPNASEAQFCQKNFLSSQNLANIEDLKSQLLSNVAEAGFVKLTGDDRHALSRIQNTTSRARRFVVIPAEVDTHSDDLELVSSVIAWAFYPKLLTREGKGWRNVATNQAISVHPTSVIRQAPSSSFGNVKFLSFYSILQSSGGAKNYNANSLSPVTGVALLLLGGSASFQATGQAVTIDNARMRFAIDAPRQRAAGGKRTGEGTAAVGAWKTLVALKYLRRRMEEGMRRAWRKPDERMPDTLMRWTAAWEEVLMHWKSLEA